MTKADPAGGILYSSFLLGQNGAAYAIAVDNVQKTTFITGNRDGDGGVNAFLARIGASAVLSIEKEADVEIVTPGNRITYTLTYRNYGELDATGAVLTETVPENTVFRPTFSTPGWSCRPDDQAGSVCTFEAGNIGTGNHVTVIFAVDLSTLYSNTACAEVVPPAPELAPKPGSGKAFKAAVCATATTPLN